MSFDNCEGVLRNVHGHSFQTDMAKKNVLCYIGDCLFFKSFAGAVGWLVVRAVVGLTKPMFA